MGADGRVSDLDVCESDGAPAGVEGSDVRREGGREGGKATRSKQRRERRLTDKTEQWWEGGREGERANSSKKRRRT